MRIGNPDRRWRRRGAIGASLVSTAALAATSMSPAVAADGDVGDAAAEEMRVENVLAHLDEFQAIADRNGGTRYASSSGYDESAAYVAGELRNAGYDVTIQEFPFVYTEERRESLTEVSPTQRTLPIDVMTYSGSTPAGGITASLSTVAEDADPGCQTTDFGADTAGTVALVKRGSCTFAIKAQNAAAAGAVAAIVYNNDAANPDEEVNGTLGAPDATSLPTGGVSLNTGEALRAELATGPVEVTIDLEEFREDRTTKNVLAESTSGAPNDVVMAGAHLDSVNAGPGINDNGTGSAALLETALNLADTEPANKLRFAWWGAEEFGLLGSDYYVQNLTTSERNKIALYLNFDMIGSPNGVISIYDGDDSDAIGSGPGPKGSAQVEDVFERFFDERAMAHIGSDFTGRSDYGPFLEFGIPAGGLATGADGHKTDEHVALFGGVAGPIFDPCYHQACDSMTPVKDGADRTLYRQLDREFEMHGNVNVEYLEKMADAMAYAVATFGADVSSLHRPAQESPASARTGQGIHAVKGDEHHDVPA